MKDLGKTKFRLVLQIEHLQMGILVYQSAYVQKVLEKIQYGQSIPPKNSHDCSCLEKGY
jgi:hypothetical protein